MRKGRMTREILRIDGVPNETKELLKAAALQRYGKANASLLVRTLIAEHLEKTKLNVPTETIYQDEKRVRVELRLPFSVASEISRRAEEKLSDRNYYIKALIYKDIGQAQLHVDEIETLRRSNYEIAKIGSNLNQVAKAFNILVKMGGGEKLPEIGKKMAALKKDIGEHTNKVLRVLNAKTIILEAKGRGQKKKKVKK